MTSAPIRDPLSDHLLTPENAAFLFIDYQPSQLAGVRSMDQALLLNNAVSTVRTIKAFGVPVVHSTVNVATGRGGPTLPELAELLADDKPLDRTTVNSMEAEPSQERPGGFLVRRPAAVSSRAAIPGHEPWQEAVLDLVAGSGQPSADKAHDIRVGVELGQVVDIGHGELPEHQSFGLQENTLR